MSKSSKFLLELSNRQYVYESLYIDHLQRTVQILFGNFIDKRVLKNFLLSKNQKIDLENSLKNSWTLVASDCFEVCGVCIGISLDLSSSKFDIGNVDNVFQIQCLEVLPEYESNHLLKETLLKQMLIIAYNSNFSSVIYNCTDLIKKKLAKKFEMESIIENKNSNGSLMFANLKKITKIWRNSLSPLPDAYKLKEANRILKDTFMVESLNREIRIVEALPMDEPIVKHYALNEVLQQMPSTKTFQFTRDELIELVNYRLKREQFEQGFVFLVLDNNKLCGMLTNQLIDLSMEGKQKVVDTNLPTDFNKLAKRLPFKSERLRAYIAAIQWMHLCALEYLPNDCNSYLRVEMANVHSHYENNGIGRQLGISNLMFALERNIFTMESLAIALSTSKPIIAVGGVPSRIFPYSDFKYNGEELFPGGRLVDGATAAYLFVRDLRDPVTDSERENLTKPRAKY